MIMANLHIRKQGKAFHARQIARLIAVAWTEIGWLDRAEQDEAMSGEGLPALMVTTPDGREFLITVEENPHSPANAIPDRITRVEDLTEWAARMVRSRP
jgi:hypothetical protein